MNDYDETCPCCDLYLRDGHADNCELMGAYEALEEAQKERDEAREIAEYWRDVVNAWVPPRLCRWGALPWENEG